MVSVVPQDVESVMYKQPTKNKMTDPWVNLYSAREHMAEMHKEAVNRILLEGTRYI